MLNEKKDFIYEVSDWKNDKGRILRTDGCILLFCTEGMAIVSVEFKPRIIRKHNVALIFPDTMFVINEASNMFSIKYIEVSSALFDETTFTLSSQFFDLIYDNPLLYPDPDQWELLETWEKQLRWLIQCRMQKSVYIMLRNHLQNFFMGLECILFSEGVQSLVQPIGSTRQLFNSFCRLVMEHCHAEHEVKFYAEKLSITPYYLSKITRKTMGASAKELIDRQIVTEIKRLLTTTDISIKELAAEFHFDTMSYMARFFRRHTGFTPIEYRKL